MLLYISEIYLPQSGREFNSIHVLSSLQTFYVIHQHISDWIPVLNILFSCVAFQGHVCIQRDWHVICWVAFALWCCCTLVESKICCSSSTSCSWSNLFKASLAFSYNITLELDPRRAGSTQVTHAVTLSPSIHNISFHQVPINEGQLEA